MPCVDCAADIQTRDGEVCETCAPLNHSRCVGCGELYRDGSDCDRCTTCDRCDATVRESETVETTRGSTICALCRQHWYWQCGQCDGWNRDGADCGNGCCDPDVCDCGECRRDELGGLVHDYYYKPPPVFHGTGPLFLGPEIEIETPDCSERECAEIAYSHLADLGYLKLDSSIGNGFEIVTHPMSYEWAMANFPWQMLTRLRESGCEATENTGIHVHLSRAGFDSPCHIYRWMKFIYRNEPQVKAVARRSSDEWAAFTDDDRKAVKDYAKGARGGRHRAINTNNHDTFELRVFASSLDPREVKAALGFAAAPVEYTRNLTVHTIANGGWTWPAFTGWLAEQPAYQPLTQQLEELQCVC
ncbi:MAG: hypothetical protein ACRDSK_32480 [Actinophytocola sp.]|uniref:hypothetical protein n=1 Tax=Actinophytocola sp. TaxID=1872138 RepID=UPI003D6A719F